MSATRLRIVKRAAQHRPVQGAHQRVSHQRATDEGRRRVIEDASVKPIVGPVEVPAPRLREAGARV